MSFAYSRLFSHGAARKVAAISTIATMLASQTFPGLFLSTAWADTAVTTATGGTNIVVDEAATGDAPAESPLTDIELAEAAFGEITTGTIVIDAPAGFQFKNEVTDEIAVTVSGAEMQIGADGGGATQSANLVADDATSFTLYVNAATTTTPATITFSNIKIQPTATTPASGNLTVNVSSTSTIAGVTEGVTSLGALSSVAAAIDHYVVRAADGTSDTTTATVGQNATIKVIPVDAYDNVTVGSATATISATSGPTGAMLGVTNADTDAGTDTIATMTFDRAGVYVLDVDDTVNNSAGDAAYDLEVTVSAGALTGLDATPATLVAGADDDLTVTFVATNGIPNDGKIIVDLPAGYNATGATVASIDDADAGTTEPGIASVGLTDGDGTNDEVTITFDGNDDPIDAGKTVTFTITGVRVPQVSGNPGNVTVTTQDSDGDEIDAVTADPAGDDSILAATITTANVQPADLKVGEEGLVTVSFTTVNPIPADGIIDVTFPAGFDLTGSANVNDETNIDGGFAISVAGQTATIERNGMGTAVPAATAVSFTIDSIRNPLSATTTGDYEIATKDISGTKIDEKTDVSGDIIAPNNISASSVELGNRQSGATTSASVVFTTTNAIPDDGKIIIDFDDDFDLSGVDNADISSSTMDGTFTVSRNAGSEILTITRAGGTDEAAGAQDIVIAGIINPATAQTTDGYGITTTTAGGGEIDQEIGVDGTLVFGNLVSANAEPDSLVAGAVGDVVVTFTTEQAVPADGKIVITLPSGFALSSGSATAVTDGGSYNGTDYSGVGIAGQVVTLTGDGAGTGIGAGDTVTITLSNIKNPTVSGSAGTYSILTTDSSDAEVDADFAVAADTITAGALASVSVVPDSLVAGNTTTATVTFTTANPVPANGKIVVVFPAGFDVSTVGMSDVTTSGDIDGALAATVAGQIVTITRSGGTPLAAGSVVDDLVIQNVKNPGVSGTTGTYTVRTTNTSNAHIDSTAGVAGSAITAGSLDSANVQPASLVAGAEGNVTITFATSNIIPNNGKIVIDFPAGFDADGAAGVSVSDNNGGTTEPTISGITTVDGDGADDVATVTLAGNNTAIAAGSSVTLVISGVRNPQVSGSTGTYGITTTNSSDAAIDTVASVTADTITAGALASTNVQPASLVAGATSVVTVSFTTANPVPSTGKIEVTFPAGFSIANVQSADISSSSMDGSFTASVAGQVLTITRAGGTAEPAGAQTVSINNSKVRNPQVSGSTGTYGIATMTAGDADIDVEASVTADTVTTGTVTSASYSQTNLGIGMRTDATFTFTLANPVPVDGIIVLELPTDSTNHYDLSDITNLDVTVTDVTQDDGLSVDAIDTSTDDTIEITLDAAGATEPGDQITVEIGGLALLNPSVAATTSGGSISTFLADGTTGIDVSGSISGVTLVPILSETDVEPASLVPGATTSVAVELKLNQPLPADGKIVVTLPAGFDVSDADTLYAVSGMDGTFVLAVDSGTRKLTVTRSGNGTQTNAGTRVKFSVSDIGAPSSAGSTGLYSIRTTTSANALIELDDAVLADTLSLSNDTTAPVFTLSPYAYDITETAAKVKFVSNESGSYSLSVGTGASALSETASGSMTTGILASADIAGLSADTLYYYELAVEDAAGNVSTNGGSFRTNAYDAPEISAFDFSGITATGVAISWANDAASFASAYKISTSSTLAGASWTSVTPSGTGASAQINSLSASTVYYVQVRNVKNGLTTVSPIYSFTTSSADSGVAVRSVVVMKNFGLTDNTYMNGWQFRFNITVNDEDEQYMKFKLADWIGAQSGTLATSGNTLGVNPFAATYADEAAITGPGVSLGTTYSAQSSAFTLVDTDPNTGGIQATFDVFVKLPSNTTITTFTSAYGIKTATTSTITD